MTEIVSVPLAERSYEVRIGRRLIDDLSHATDAFRGAGASAVVTQASVRGYAERVRAALEAEGVEGHVIEIPHGETAKSATVLQGIWDEFAAIALGRRDVIVAVGGGVVGDLAGFAAATWHRGVAVVQVPTTLLAQVDAAIGGKTGINLAAGKNLVGAFHQPRAVVCDVETLATLPRRDLVAGLAEVVKCGLIRDPDVLDILEDRPDDAVEGDPAALTELIVHAVTVKATVVAADERESGEREHLNLGHTLGHALESITAYEELRHGEAVAIGTCFALRLGANLGRTPPELIGRTEDLLRRLGLPTRTAIRDRDVLWSAMRRDKKAHDEVRFVVLDDLARPTVVPVDRETVEATLVEVQEA